MKELDTLHTLSLNSTEWALKVQHVFDNLDKRLLSLEQPRKPDPDDLSRDKNGHKLERGDLIGYPSCVPNSPFGHRLGIFHHAEKGEHKVKIWGNWQEYYRRSFENGLEFIYQDEVVFIAHLLGQDY